MAKSRTSVVIVAVLLLLGILLGLSLVAAELYLRTKPEYGRTGFTFDKDLIYRLTPNLTAQKPFASGHAGQPPFDLHFNNYGFRGPDIQVKKEPGTTRILMIGDSYQAGLDYPDSLTFVALYERHLNSTSDGSFEVINASCPAWGTDQHYIFWKKEGRQLQPDHVVITFSPNDIREMYNHKLVRTDQQGKIQVKEANLPEDEKKGWVRASKYSLYQYLQKNRYQTEYGNFLRVFQFYPVHYGIHDSTDWDQPLFEAEPIAQVEESYDLFETLIRDIQSDCEEIGSQLHLVKLPIKLEFDDTYTDSLFSKTIVEERITEIAQRNKIPFYNLNESLRQEDNPLNIFMDWEYHYDEDGQRWVAHQLINHLNPK